MDTLFPGKTLPSKPFPRSNKCRIVSPIFPGKMLAPKSFPWADDDGEFLGSPLVFSHLGHQERGY